MLFHDFVVVVVPWFARIHRSRFRILPRWMKNHNRNAAATDDLVVPTLEAFVVNIVAR